MTNTPFDKAVSFLQSVCMGAKSQTKGVCRVTTVLLGLQTGVSAHPGPARVLGSRERRRSASPGHRASFEKVSPIQDRSLNTALIHGVQTSQALLQQPVPLFSRLLKTESSEQSAHTNANMDRMFNPLRIKTYIKPCYRFHKKIYEYEFPAHLCCSIGGGF